MIGLFKTGAEMQKRSNALTSFALKTLTWTRMLLTLKGGGRNKKENAWNSFYSWATNEFWVLLWGSMV